MRKLKLQMHMSLDGFVSTVDGKPMMPPGLVPALEKMMFQDVVETCDTILLGRNITMGDGFVRFWAQQAVSGVGRAREFGARTVQMQKVMFSKTVERADGENLRVENGPLVQAVEALKAADGKDLIVYGGVGFVSSLIQHGLVDEMHLIVSPVSLGAGGRIFSARTQFRLLSSTSYDNGVVVNAYAR